MEKGHSALRRGRVSVPGEVYLVTAVVRGRAPVFADVGHARVVANLHGLAGAFLDATPLAWVLMPDHWHGVLRLGHNAALSAVVRQFKTRVCRELRLACGFHGPLWQAAYHDHRLCDDTAIHNAIAYLRANPVRAGLCVPPHEYPYADSIAPP